MDSNAVFDFKNFDVINYFIWLKRRVTTVNDKSSR